MPWTYGSNEYGQLGIGEVDAEPESATIRVTELKLAPVHVQVQYRLPEPAPVWSASFESFTLKDAKVKVLTVPNKYVLVYKGEQLLAEGASNELGIFEFKLPSKNKDGIYSAIVTDISEDILASASYAVGDTKPPASPKVTAAAAKTTLVKGYAEALSTVTIVRQGKSYQAKASSTGVFQVSVPALAASESLRVWTTDTAGNKSQEIKVKVAAAPKK
ncbi:Ig-like domain-containing protein [Paenibacillus kobensis]|uniref:Ig-like domain-containing protein n=1 Tax=Paenibacillus kobensis TaxID=59841 RepID=UPI000FD9934B|nr:Ig-like domain-containing protein [Paenibacillus kobensis]